jgi:LacI family transcriptional regulator
VNRSSTPPDGEPSAASPVDDAQGTDHPGPGSDGDAVRATVTIYDVARRAAVAPSTVSRAFARPGLVNSETAARIRAAAAELGYRTTALARPATSTKTRMLTLMISDVTNPFFAELVRGAQLAASAADYTVLLTDARESTALEREALERVLPMVDGVVIGSSRMSDSALQTIAKQKPTVVLNRHLVGVPSVITDNARGMRRAVEHLGELGHEHFTYVAGPEASWVDGARWRALREATHELDLHAHRAGPVAPTADGGSTVARTLLEDLPTAVIAYNDLVAIGLMLALAAAGVRVPQDVSVIGFDDIMPAALVSPGLTTVAAPVRTLGTTAVKNVLAMIDGALPASDEALVLPTRLVVRRSTAAPRS